MADTVFAFTSDLLDEGVDTALDRTGAGGVTVAGVYHASRDVFPHHPTRRVQYLDGGVHYFQPSPEYYGEIKPVTAVAEDPFEQIRAATAARGAAFNAWLVYLHNDRIGFSQPEYAPRNVYGDPYRTDLCPANPAVREYAVALTRDVARYGCDLVLAESLHYHPLGHGNHHERYLFALGPLAEFLLGLCFCSHCVLRAIEDGIDVAGLVKAVRAITDQGLSGEVPGPDGEVTLETVAGGELPAFLDSRQRTVTSLVEEVRAALDGSGTAFCFMDQAGAMKGYATGQPSGALAADVAWQLGVDVAGVSAHADAYQVLAYAQDPERIRADVAAYQERLASGVPLRCALRPTPPDCTSAENLAAKLDVLDALGVGDRDFYHYGLLPLRNLEMLRGVLVSRMSSR